MFEWLAECFQRLAYVGSGRSLPHTHNTGNAADCKVAFTHSVRAVMHSIELHTSTLGTVRARRAVPILHLLGTFTRAIDVGSSTHRTERLCSDRAFPRLSITPSTANSRPAPTSARGYCAHGVARAHFRIPSHHTPSLPLAQVPECSFMDRACAHKDQTVDSLI